MNYLMCTEFINFIKENGRDILKNPQNFEASLQAYCSTKLTSNVYKTEAFILTEALREGIIQELLEVKIVSDTLIRKLSKQLQATCGFTEYASNGAIDTWCYALGLKEVPVQKVEEARVIATNSSSEEPLTSRGIVMMVLGAVFFFLGLVLTADSYETAANKHKAANKSYTVFYGLVAFGAISFIRGFIQMIQYYTQSSEESEKTNAQSSTNTNYSQKASGTDTYSSDNPNYTKKSENVKSQDSDADYFNQTSNQSTKKDEQSKKEKTFEDRFEELKRLHEKGIITEAEFQTRKTEILKEL
ncbi:MAG: SHOCT domain-containing protein [Leptospiraceae bacterium]|nr:SHOCT domain-containing protein [Leptospiraceae bacterium]